MFRRIIKTTISILFCISFISCSGMVGESIDYATDTSSGINTGLPQLPTLSNIDITNASLLFISSNDGINNNELYKINNNTLVEKVTYKDIKGDNISLQVPPSVIYSVNSTYVIVCFGFNQHVSFDAYLVRKTDGAAFSLKNIGIPSNLLYSFVNEGPVRMDNNGNLYYLTQITRKCIKINISNPSSLSASIISPNTEQLLTYQLIFDTTKIFGQIEAIGILKIIDTNLNCNVTTFLKIN